MKERHIESSMSVLCVVMCAILVCETFELRVINSSDELIVNLV